MILYRAQGKIQYPRNILLHNGKFNNQMAWIMYDSSFEKTLLVIEYFDVFDFVNEMINEGHIITFKP
jgi:hypothetical protein